MERNPREDLSSIPISRPIEGPSEGGSATGSGKEVIINFSSQDQAEQFVRDLVDTMEDLVKQGEFNKISLFSEEHLKRIQDAQKQAEQN